MTAIVRAAARGISTVGWTFSLLAGLEVNLRLQRDKRAVNYRWMKRYGRGLLHIYGVDVRTAGPYLDEHEPYAACDARGIGRIFVMNHRSMMDIMVDLAFIEANTVSRADLAGWPVIGVAARRTGTLFVDRENKASGNALANTMCASLRAGRGVLVYPEGTTVPGDTVGPFRRGAFVAAARTGAEVVPLGIAYDHDASHFGDESFLSHFRRIASAKRTKVALVAGTPLLPSSDPAALADAAHARVQALVHTARKLLTPGWPLSKPAPP